MARMFISEAQAQALLDARGKPNRASLKRIVFRELRQQYGIPTSTRLKVAVEDHSNPLWRVLRNKRTGLALDNGLPEPVVEKAASPAKKAPAKKAPAKKAASPAKKAASPAKKALTKAPAKSTFSKTKVDACQIEVRATIDGKRVRLGWASDEAAKARAIARAKK